MLNRWVAQVSRHNRISLTYSLSRSTSCPDCRRLRLVHVSNANMYGAGNRGPPPESVKFLVNMRTMYQCCCFMWEIPMKIGSSKAMFYHLQKFKGIGLVLYTTYNFSRIEPLQRALKRYSSLSLNSYFRTKSSRQKFFRNISDLRKIRQQPLWGPLGGVRSIICLPIEGFCFGYRVHL